MRYGRTIELRAQYEDVIARVKDQENAEREAERGDGGLRHPRRLQS